MTATTVPTSVPTPPENWEGLSKTCLLWYDGPLIELYTTNQGDGWFTLLADVNLFEDSTRVEEIWMAAHLTTEQIAAYRACVEIGIDQIFKASGCVREIHALSIKNTANNHGAVPLWTHQWASLDVVDYAQANDLYKAEPQATINFNV